MLSRRTREATGQLPGKSSATPAQLEPKRNRHDVKRQHGCLPVKKPTAQHQRRRAGEMLSTRSQVATRQLAAEDYAATPQRVSRGHKSSLQTAEGKSTQSQADRWILEGGPEKLALLQAAGFCQQSMSEQLDLRKRHDAGRQGNAPHQHQWQRNGIDANNMISPSQTGACRSGKVDISTTLN